jgi:hypothetical protein
LLFLALMDVRDGLSDFFRWVIHSPSCNLFWVSTSCTRLVYPGLIIGIFPLEVFYRRRPIYTTYCSRVFISFQSANCVSYPWLICTKKHEPRLWKGRPQLHILLFFFGISRGVCHTPLQLDHFAWPTAVQTAYLNRPMKLAFG